MKKQPPYPKYPELYVWDFIHGYEYEAEEIVEFCQEVLGFTPRKLSFVSRSVYDSSSNRKIYDGYVSTHFTFRTENDALAVKMVFGEYAKKDEFNA